MKNTIKYKGYVGTVEYSQEDECLHGRIVGIHDIISYEGESVTEIIRAFEEAVDDYIILCKENGKKIEKSYKGSFNVRIAPEIHKKAKMLSVMQGISLNQFIQKAVEQEVLRESLSN